MVIVYLILQSLALLLNQQFIFARTPKFLAVWAVSTAATAAIVIYGPDWLGVTIVAYTAIVLCVLLRLTVGLLRARRLGAV